MWSLWLICKAIASLVQLLPGGPVQVFKELSVDVGPIS